MSLQRCLWRWHWSPGWCTIWERPTSGTRARGCVFARQHRARGGCPSRLWRGSGFQARTRGPGCLMHCITAAGDGVIHAAVTTRHGPYHPAWPGDVGHLHLQQEPSRAHPDAFAALAQAWQQAYKQCANGETTAGALAGASSARCDIPGETHTHEPDMSDALVPRRGAGRTSST